MIKQLLTVLAVLTLLTCSQTLKAQEQDKNPYDPFQIEIPAGWKASYNPGSGQFGQSLKVTSPDGLAFFSLELVELKKAADWDKMIENMSVRPTSGHGQPSLQSDTSFSVSFGDASTGMAGRKTYQIVKPDCYVIQQILGFHADLATMVNSTKINFIEE